jgi:hypothetical protein
VCAQANGLTGAQPRTEAIATLQKLVQSSNAAQDSAMAARATLLLADALHAQHIAGAPVRSDPRPHIVPLLQMLADARRGLLPLLERSVPADTPQGVRLPLRTLHIQLVCRMAELHGDFAAADFAQAEDDARARRPAFPQVDGADASAVAAFLDSTSDAARAEQACAAPSPVDHAQSALLWAEHAKALGCEGVLLGRCHLVCCRVDAMRWHEATDGSAAAAWPKAISQTTQNQVDATSTSVADAAMDEAHEGAASSTASCPVPAEEVAAAQRMHSEAVAAGQEAVCCLVAQHSWSAAAQAAAVLADLHGVQAPIEAAAAISLMRACKHAAAVWTISQELAPKQSPERLQDKEAAQLGPQAEQHAAEGSAAHDGVTAYIKAQQAVLRCAKEQGMAKAMQDSLAALPPGVRLLTFELGDSSDAISPMYLASVARSSPVADGPTKLDAAVRRAHMNIAALGHLAARFTSFERLLLAQASQTTANSKHSAESSTQDGTLVTASPAASDDHLATMWAGLISDLEHSMVPFAEILQAAAAEVTPTIMDTATNGKPVKGKAAEPVSGKAAVVLCLPESLAALPLEALSALKSAGAITRDVSACEFARRAQGLDGVSVPLASAVCRHSAEANVSQAFTQRMLTPLGQGWDVEVMQSSSVESVAEQVRVLQAAPMYVHCSHERMAQRLAFQGLCEADLSGLKLAWLMDNLATPESAHGLAVAQQRGTKAQQALWRADRVGSLVLQRGARCCVLSRYPDAPEQQLQACASALTAAVAGVPLAEALKAAGESRSEDELRSQPWQAYSTIVLGLPHITLEASKPGKKK